MSVDTFKAALDAARRITVPVGEKKFHLIAPTDHAWRCAVEANRDGAGRVMEAKAFRGLLDTALVGWESVTTADIAVDVAAEPLPFSPENAALLLDHRQDIADELTLELGVRMAERRTKRESARKNSSSAPSSS